MESERLSADGTLVSRPIAPATRFRRGTERAPRRWQALPLSLILLAFGADAEVYRWVDQDGRVQYGDRPPAGEGEEIKLRVPPAPPTASPDQSERRELQQRLLDIYREDREAKKQATEKARQQAEERKKNCDEARVRLEYYTSASGIYERNEAGDRVFLSFEEREQYIEELRQDVARWCES